jgi:hypothetical protein
VVERKGSWESGAIGVILQVGGGMNRKGLWEKKGTVGADVIMITLF